MRPGEPSSELPSATSTSSSPPKSWAARSLTKWSTLEPSLRTGATTEIVRMGVIEPREPFAATSGAMHHY